MKDFNRANLDINYIMNNNFDMFSDETDDKQNDDLKEENEENNLSDDKIKMEYIHQFHQYEYEDDEFY